MIFLKKLENRITLITSIPLYFFQTACPVIPLQRPFSVCPLPSMQTSSMSVPNSTPTHGSHVGLATSPSSHELQNTLPPPERGGGHLGMCTHDLSFISSPQIDMFILGYSLEVKIKVFRLFKFNSRDFEVCYPEESLREWPEISLLTENDRHYHIPVF